LWLALSLFSAAQQPASDAIASKLDKLMRARSAAGDFSGTVLVARRGKIVYQQAFGVANREWNIPNDLQTKFEIGSMTKQFTAMLVLQLVNEGKLQLDGHISDYLPYYPQDTGKRVTISQLLTPRGFPIS
jgi:CubicO group peptidase (beta-lactamase class C family)